MKVVIFGSGGVGGYFGGRLAQAGHDVSFLARSQHLKAILTNGLQVQSISGDFTIHPAKATDQVETIGQVDVVLCCVKSWQVPDAAAAMRPLIGSQTVVIPLQNGVEAHTHLSDALGTRHVLPGLCKIIAMLDGPGSIQHVGADPYLAFGEMDGQLSPRAKEIAAAFGKAQGVTVHLSQNIFTQVWKKFMLIAPWSGLGALTRSPIGIMRSQRVIRQMLLDAIREVYAVAQANQVVIAEKAIDDTLAFIDQVPSASTASMQRDIMNGRPSELEEQSGAVVRYGKKAGVPTPINRLIYHSLLPLEKKARGEISFD